MAKPSKDELAVLRQKEAQIHARIEAVLAREKEAERKKDARRKILIGGAMLAKIKRGAWSQKQLADLLDSELKADRDRELFDLKPLPGNQAKGGAGEAAS
jgi:hypothetical protein